MSKTYLTGTPALRLRTLCMALLLALAPLSEARADCPAAPIASPDDLVVSFLAAHGVQAASASLLPSSVKPGMLVYDGSDKALKLCDGAAWQRISVSGSASDPRIGTLAADKWCAASAAGDKINCTSTAPATGAAGTASEVQFRDSATGAFAADASLTWDKANKRLGVGTASPDPSATLEIGGTSKGFLPPRLTTAQRNAIASPANGLMIFNVSTGQINVYNTGWRIMGSSCLAGYSEFSGNCYRYFAAAATNAAARAACAAEGGYLARVGSAAENAYVYSLLPGGVVTAWIDGSDEAVEGTWRYSDGTAVTYFNWNTGEPNNSGGDQDCIPLYGPGAGVSASRWDDLQCSAATPHYICELD